MTLSALQSASGRYCILELDRLYSAVTHGSSLGLVDAQNEQKAKAMAELGASTSGVVLDSSQSFQSLFFKPHDVGLVLSLEQRMDAVDPLALPRIGDGWSLDHIRNNYGVAKLELYYHPGETLALKKKQFVAEIADYCRYIGIAFILQLYVYHTLADGGTDTAKMIETQLRSVQEFGRHSDLLAIEYLGDPLAAATITAELDIPWVVTSRQSEYETCKNDLRAALESGASGFMLGDVFVSGASKVASDTSDEFEYAGWEKVIQTTVRDRVLELSRITNEFSL